MKATWHNVRFFVESKGRSNAEDKITTVQAGISANLNKPAKFYGNSLTTGCMTPCVEQGNRRVAKHEKITAECYKPYLRDANWITKDRKYPSMAYHTNIVQIAANDLNSMLL